MIELDHLLEEFKTKLKKLKEKSELTINNKNFQLDKSDEKQKSLFKRIKKEYYQLSSEINEIALKSDKVGQLIKHRSKFEKIISAISVRFVGTSDIDGAINISLGDIGKLSKASRSYLFMFNNDNRTMTNTHEWCAEEVAPKIDDWQGLSLDIFPWWMEQLNKGVFLHIEDISKMPAEAAAEKEILQSQDIKSFMIFPLMLGGKISGFIGFDNVREKGEWSYEDFVLLRTSSEIIGNAFKYKIAEQKLKESEKELRLLNKELENRVEQRTKKLKESEEKYRIICENANDYINVLNEKFEYEYLNKSLDGRLVGYKKEDRRGLSPLEFIHPEDRQKAIKALRKCFKTGEGMEEIRFKDLDGNYIWFEVKGKSFIDKNGNEKAIVISRNVNEHKLAEKKLKESEEKYRNIINNTKEAIIILKIDGEFSFVSPQFFMLLGRNKGKNLEIKDIQSLSKFIHPDDFNNLIFLIKRGTKQKAVVYDQDVEFRALHKEGHYIWLSASSKNYYDENGNIIGFISVLRDVTTRKKAEQKLIESEEKYRIFVENFQGIAFRGHQDFSVAFFHGVIEKITGYKEEDFISGNIRWDQLVHPDDFPRVQEAVKQFHSTSAKLDKREYRIISRNGKIHWVIESIQKIYDNLRKEEVVQGIIYDITERKKAEQKLKESEEKYHSLFKSSISGIAIHKVIYNSEKKPINYVMTDVNPKYYEILSLKEEDVINKLATDAYGTEEAPYLEIYAKVAETLEPTMFETYFPPMDKHFHISVFAPEKGKFVTVFEDTTERKRAKQKLKESEEKYRIICENLNDMVYVFNENFEFEYINEEVHMRLMGYSKDDLIGKSTIKFIHPEDLKKAVKILRNSFKGRIVGKEGMEELRIKDKNDIYHWLEIRGKTFIDQDGKFKAILIARGISERKKAEQKLKESEEKYRFITENANDLISVLDKNFKLIYLNDTIKKMSGFTKKEIIGKNPMDYIHPDDVKICLKIFQEVLKTGEGRGEYRMKRKDGIYIWLEVNAKIIIDKNNESKFILVSKDISKRKLADMKLKESEEKFRIIAENANDLIDIMNQNLQEEFYNEQAYVKILGYSKNELYSMHALDFVHPDDLEELITLYKEGFKKGEGIADVRLRHKKGHYLWFEIKGKTFFDKKGEKKALFISREITERKKSEDLLRKHAKKIEIINRIIMAGNKTKNLSKLLQIIIESTIEIMNFDGGGIYLVDDKTGIAEIVCHKGLPSDFIENTNYLKIDESPYNIIFIKGQSIITENYQKFNPERSKRWGLLSLASVPLFVKDKIIGAINIVSKNRYSFSNEEKEILQTIGRETGTVIAKIEAENALREGKAFLSNIFASIQDGISILDKEFNIIRVNPAMENWYSDMKPLIGKKCYYTFFNRTKPCEDCRCFEIINSDESFCNRIYNKKTNGEIDKIFDIYSFPLLDQKTGELKGLIHYLRDVTKRYKAQGKQKESEVKYRSILENIKEGYFELDLQGNYTFFNKAMCNILGYSQDELIGLNYTRYMEENTIKKVKKVFNNVYNTEVSHTAFQYEVLRKNKEKIFIETSVYLKFDSDGNKVGYCGLLRDITAKIKSEQVILTEIKKLKELDQIKNKFVYRASHELKTPLNSIYSASSLLLKLYKDKFDERATRLLKIINYGGERLEKLIKNMLDVSRIESGKIELKKRKENITKIIKESANELIDLIQDREINLNLKIEGDYYINVDGFRITQVLINLLSNAIKYTPPKGIISINLQKTDDYIDIKVNDTGIGFTAAEKKKIFKKFGKIERYGKGMDIITEGSGLGLYISKEIVNEHNGIIWVESEGRNKGSTFIIRLPV